jgi:predicted PurR-regulated permease PerM
MARGNRHSSGASRAKRDDARDRDDDGFSFPTVDADGAAPPSSSTPSPSRPVNFASNFPTVSPSVPIASRRDATVITLGVAVIAAACSVWLLQVLAYLLRPLVTAIGVALLLRPLVDFVSDSAYQRVVLRRSRTCGWSCTRAITVPRIIAIVFALCVVVGVFGTLLWALYLGRVYVWVHWSDRDWNAKFLERINQIGQSLSEWAARVFKKDDVAEQAWGRLLSNLEATLKTESFWENLGVGLFHYMQDVMLMLFYTLFLLAPRRDLSRTRSLVVRRIHAATRRFISIMVQIALVRALLVGVLIGFCGVPWALAIALAIVSFWLFFIPTLGSIIATFLPLPMLVLLPDLSYNQRVAGAIIPAFVSFLLGDLIGPVVYRKGLDLNEVTVLLALVFWYSVWGAAGAVLGVPLTCAMKIVLEEMPHDGAHALAAVMAPAQSGTPDSEDESAPSVRTPMTITFIAWVRRSCVRLFTPKRRGESRNEETLLGDSSSEDIDV